MTHPIQPADEAALMRSIEEKLPELAPERRKQAWELLSQIRSLDLDLHAGVQALNADLEHEDAELRHSAESMQRSNDVRTVETQLSLLP